MMMGGPSITVIETNTGEQLSYSTVVLVCCVVRSITITVRTVPQRAKKRSLESFLSYEVPPSYCTISNERVMEEERIYKGAIMSQQRQQRRRLLRKLPLRNRRNYNNNNKNYLIGLKISFLVGVIVTTLYSALHTTNTELIKQQYDHSTASFEATTSTVTSRNDTTTTTTRHHKDDDDDVEEDKQRPTLTRPRQQQDETSVSLKDNRTSIPKSIQDMILTTTSDFVELDHCSLNRVNWKYFSNWSQPVIEKTTEDFSKKSLIEFDTHTTVVDGGNNLNLLRHLQEEWTLELLEMYATYHGYCDFTTKYRPKTITTASEHASKQLQRIVETVAIPPNHVRIVYCIIAYRDVTHLKRLIQAIHLPHHLIIIHLDNDTKKEFRKDIEEEIVQHYSNVVIVQFGTVIYKTDTVSMINVRIMEYIHNTMNINYDYYITLGGATYPLLKTATEASNYLYDASQQQRLGRNLGVGNVWLGELYHKGRRVEPSHQSQVGVLLNKRLLTSSLTLSKFLSSIVSNATTTIPTTVKFQQRIGFIFGSSLLSNTSTNNNTSDPSSMSTSAIIEQHMKYKSVSGNQAIFSYTTVNRLLHNPIVLQLFALSKYGCCCCIEERTWIAAMSLLDSENDNGGDDDDDDDDDTSLLQEALRNTAMFQVWGGGESSACRGSMNNAILTQNASTCFRIEHPPPQQRLLQEQHRQEAEEEGNYSWPHSSTGRGGPKDPTSVYFWGNTTMDILHHAKDHGYLFVRKFDSNNLESTELLTSIMKRTATRGSNATSTTTTSTTRK